MRPKYTPLARDRPSQPEARRYGRYDREDGTPARSKTRVEGQTGHARLWITSARRSEGSEPCPITAAMRGGRPRSSAQSLCSRMPLLCKNTRLCAHPVDNPISRCSLRSPSIFSMRYRYCSFGDGLRFVSSRPGSKTDRAPQSRGSRAKAWGFARFLRPNEETPAVGTGFSAPGRRPSALRSKRPYSARL